MLWQKFLSFYLQVIHTLNQTKEFIDKRLEEECSKENMSVEEGGFFYISRSKKLTQKNIFYFIVLGFKAEMFLQHLTPHVKKYSMKLNLYLFACYLELV